MAKFTKADLDFPFGANVKLKKPKGGKGKKGGKSNAWRAYVSPGKKR